MWAPTPKLTTATLWPFAGTPVKDIIPVRRALLSVIVYFCLEGELAKRSSLYKFMD
jgi:hypothetical protein